MIGGLAYMVFIAPRHDPKPHEAFCGHCDLDPCKCSPREKHLRTALCHADLRSKIDTCSSAGGEINAKAAEIKQCLKSDIETNPVIQHLLTQGPSDDEEASYHRKCSGGGSGELQTEAASVEYKGTISTRASAPVKDFRVSIAGLDCEDRDARPMNFILHCTIPGGKTPEDYEEAGLTLTPGANSSWKCDDSVSVRSDKETVVVIEDVCALPLTPPVVRETKVECLTRCKNLPNETPAEREKAQSCTKGCSGP